MIDDIQYRIFITNSKNRSRSAYGPIDFRWKNAKVLVEGPHSAFGLPTKCKKPRSKDRGLVPFRGIGSNTFPCL